MNRTAATLVAALAAVPGIAAGSLGPAPEQTRQRPAAPAKADPRAVSPDGFGPVRPGMTVAAAEKALGVKLQEAPPATPGGDRCHTAETPEIPGATFVVRGGKIERIEFYGTAYRTAGGIRVGTKAGEVKGHHPGVHASPHRYDAAGQYLMLASADGKFALVFETDGAIVTSFRCGSVAAVKLPDSCPAPGDDSRTAAR